MMSTTTSNCGATPCWLPPAANKIRWAPSAGMQAAPATLKRLELSNNSNSRCHKLPHDPKKIEGLLLEMGARCLPKHAGEIVVDLDATGHRLHGLQEGRHFNACDGDHVHLPLHAFVGNIPLWAPRRGPWRGGGAGADRGGPSAALPARAPHRPGRQRFLRDERMSGCEAHGVYDCLGLAQNSVLIEKTQWARAQARARPCLTGASTRVFTELEYETVRSWGRARRGVAKAEVSALGGHPRPGRPGGGRPAGRRVAHAGGRLDHRRARPAEPRRGDHEGVMPAGNRFANPPSPS